VTSLKKIQLLSDIGRFDVVDFGNTVGNKDNSDLLNKVQTLGAAGKYDVCASAASDRRVSSNDRIGNTISCGICRSYTPDGRCVALFKTLYTNTCSFDCKYCTNSTDSMNKQRREHCSYTPGELVKVFMALYLRNYVEGLFLSSGVKRDVDTTMEELLESIRLLRENYKFQGYIHLKILPGASYDHIQQAVEWADRVSINVESPSASRLSEIASVKDYRNDILKRQSWIQSLQKRGLLPAGQTTQFIVGAGEESDWEILSRLKWEYKHTGLKRGYFNAFDPIIGTSLETQKQVPLWREHRLYQTDWLMRIYKFEFSEIKQVLTEDGFLTNSDPKKLLAMNTFEQPLDINDGSYEELLRVPGIGPRSASRIIRMRNNGEQIKSYEQLKRIGTVLRRASPFIKVNGQVQKTLGKWWK